MTIKELGEVLEGTYLVENHNADDEVPQGGAADLMSDVLFIQRPQPFGAFLLEFIFGFENLWFTDWVHRHKIVDCYLLWQ